MSWTWKWFDLAIVIGAVLIATAVWFIPNFMNSPEMKELVATSNERKARLEAYEKQQAEIKREQEELGLVFVSPTAPVEGQRAATPKKGDSAAR